MTNQKDFIQLIQNNEGILFKISGLYSNNSTESQDLRQEMIYQLWKSYASFKGQSKISTWLYKVCLNTALVFVKKNNHRPMKVENDEQIYQMTDNQDPDFADQVHHLYQSIKKLNKIERAIILLHLEGNSYEEISEITGFKNSNIGTRLGRVKNKLTILMKGK